MKLLIHDLSAAEWEKIAADYTDWEVISNDGSINPCTGCFGCWTKEPGKCVIKDGYDNISELIHKAELVTIISRYSYGGFGSFVKNVVDRSIGYTLPYFEVYNDEMHHKPRYTEECKPIKFIFRAEGFSEDDKVKARRYLEAVCTNFRAIIRDIVFEECDVADDIKVPTYTGTPDSNKKLLLNCSLRGDKANSKKFLSQLAEDLDGDYEIVNLSQYVNNLEELATIVAGAGTLVLGLPLYVDGIPSAPLRLMEMIEKLGLKDEKKIYVVSNMGFFESQQIKNQLSMVRTWSAQCGFKYCGGVAIGAGEMASNQIKAGAKGKGPAKTIVSSLRRLAEAVNKGVTTVEIYADADNFPRGLYIAMANFGWRFKSKLSHKKICRRLD